MIQRVKNQRVWFRFGVSEDYPDTESPLGKCKILSIDYNSELMDGLKPGVVFTMVNSSYKIEKNYIVTNRIGGYPNVEIEIRPAEAVL